MFAKEARPLHLEIGTGKGRFLTTMAAEHADCHFAGVERYASVLYKALRRCAEEELTNVRFLCADASALCDWFAPGEVKRIYLNFSDPWPKKRHARRRLTSGDYLRRYEQVLTPDGSVIFKTDNAVLFEDALEQAREAGWTFLRVTHDLHADPGMMEGNVMTEYEEKFSARGNPIFLMEIEKKDRRASA